LIEFKEWHFSCGKEILCKLVDFRNTKKEDGGVQVQMDRFD